MCFPGELGLSERRAPDRFLLTWMFIRSMVQQNTLKRTGLSILTCMTHSFFGKEKSGLRVGERKKESERLDRWTDVRDRQIEKGGLSMKVFSVHSYEKEYSWCSPPFYLLLVFTLVSFLVNLVHECRSTQWVGRDFPPSLILTSSPIPDCILISPELLNQCKTNTSCQGCSPFALRSRVLGV